MSPTCLVVWCRFATHRLQFVHARAAMRDRIAAVASSISSCPKITSSDHAIFDRSDRASAGDRDDECASADDDNVSADDDHAAASASNSARNTIVEAARQLDCMKIHEAKGAALALLTRDGRSISFGEAGTYLMRCMRTSGE